MLLSASRTYPTFGSHMHDTAGCRDRSSNFAVTSYVQIDSATLSGFSILEQQENNILLQLDPVPIINDFVAEDVCWAASGKPDGHVRGRSNDVVVTYITFPDEHLVACRLHACAVYWSRVL